MNFKILTDNNNKLLERREINLDVSFTESTPKKSEIKNELSNFLKVKEDLITLKRIVSRFGEKKVLVDVNVYNNLDNLNSLEKINKKPKKKKIGKEEAEKK